MENSAVPLPVTDKLVISSFLPDILRHCPLTSSDRTICFCLICLPFHQCFGSVFVLCWSASSFFIYPAWKKTRIKTLNVNKVIERKEQYLIVQYSYQKDRYFPIDFLMFLKEILDGSISEYWSSSKRPSKTDRIQIRIQNTTFNKTTCM